MRRFPDHEEMKVVLSHCKALMPCYALVLRRSQPCGPKNPSAQGELQTSTASKQCRHCSALQPARVQGEYIYIYIHSLKHTNILITKRQPSNSCLLLQRNFAQLVAMIFIGTNCTRSLGIHLYTAKTKAGTILLVM